MKKSAPVVELTRKGVYLLKRANGRMIREKIAKRLYIRAIGRRETDGVTFAQVRFRTIHGTTLTEMFERSYLLPNKRHQIKPRLADLGYEWPEDTAVANAILKALGGLDPFSAVIMCTAQTAKGDRRTVSKWSRALRYAAQFKKEAVSLRDFVKCGGGINACAASWSRRALSTNQGRR